MTAVVSHIPAGNLAQAARRRAEADRRRTEALARLAARRMPLPGQQAAPVAEPRIHLVPEAREPQAPEVPELPRPNLTTREVEVLRTWLMVDSKPAVAQELFISLGTVNTHLTRIRAKYAELGRTAPTKAALVARAVQDGLVRLDEL
ncbi:MULTISPECIES: response regulator transcription factor [Gordonia]|jgi:DNA-binding CsgD family transcriptional regulator|uniref:response regulator transcription factor n=1 Tax=Gordonia TaxID=2053 RepID=UPI0032B4E2A6